MAHWGTAAAIGTAVGTLTVIMLTTRRASARSPITTNRRVALIGDSYAVGLGPELQKLLPDFQYSGTVGTTTSQWASKAPACGSCGDWLRLFRPGIVLVSLGVNDGSPNSANYQALVRQLHGLGARVIWIEPPAGVTTASIGAVRSIIESLGVPMVPATTAPLASDGVHPQNYAPWAAEIARSV